MAGTQTFLVYGTPRPQGSGRVLVSKTTGKGMIKAAPTSITWRNLMVEQMVRTRIVMLEGPISLTAEFHFARPKSHTRVRVANDRGIKSDGPDLDKLCRLVCDALVVARVIDDDRQIADLMAKKRYVTEGDQPEGVRVVVSEIL